MMQSLTETYRLKKGSRQSERQNGGPKWSLKKPPEIIVAGPTLFAMVNTIAKEVIAVPFNELKYSAMGTANTLQA
jgi:hypothetical protein